jgi:hypothetical protein
VDRLALEAEGAGAEDELEAEEDVAEEVELLRQYVPSTLVQMAVLRGRMRYRTS